MMVTINTISDKYFEIDGIRYARIFHPNKAGLNEISIYQIYDTKLILLAPTNYSEFSIDSVTYGNQADTIDALLNVVYSHFDTGGSGTADIRSGKGISVTAGVEKTQIYATSFDSGDAVTVFAYVVTSGGIYVPVVPIQDASQHLYFKVTPDVSGELRYFASKN